MERVRHAGMDVERLAEGWMDGSVDRGKQNRKRACWWEGQNE